MSRLTFIAIVWMLVIFVPTFVYLWRITRSKLPTLKVDRWVIQDDGLGNIVIQGEGHEVPKDVDPQYMTMMRFVGAPTGRKQEFIITDVRSIWARPPDGFRVEWHCVDMEAFMRVRKVQPS